MKRYHVLLNGQNPVLIQDLRCNNTWYFMTEDNQIFKRINCLFSSARIILNSWSWNMKTIIEGTFSDVHVNYQIHDLDRDLHQLGTRTTYMYMAVSASTFTLKSDKMILFVWSSSSHSRIFHSYGDVTIIEEGCFWPILGTHDHWALRFFSVPL